ncbi:hypothetical protein WMF11_50105 [Sorangium sp. So ce295]|uniref:hypothetical protein n=1 Tax=Sorangium sp. So ce295 TaxID=3133295 RepID=UPI003F601E3C
MKDLFAVSDPTEVIVLHRAVNEAKLPLLSYDQDLSASAILATIAERLTAALRDIPQWDDDSWRSLSPRHPAWELAVNRALSDQDYLRTAALPEKREYVRLLLAPYRNDDAKVSEFIDCVDSVLRERRWYQLWLRKASPFAGGVAFLREGPDGRFAAWDANHNEIISGSLDEVGAVLLEGNFEPFGYFVHDVPETRVGDSRLSSSSPSSRRPAPRVDPLD